MKTKHLLVYIGLAFAAIVLATIVLVVPQAQWHPHASQATPSGDPILKPVAHTTKEPTPKPIPAFIEDGAAWLAAAQFDNGGWGAGSHNRQQIRDPRAVQIDPATTAFSAMALMRLGHTLNQGRYRKNVAKALTYLLDMVEAFPEESTSITSIHGTQPQAKLGQNIDVSMVAQFFTRVLPHTKHDRKLHKRVRDNLKICLDKLGRAQDADGSWNDQGGWAGVLQSAMANSALENAMDAGLEVDQEVLERSRDYQKSNVDASTGQVRTEAAAGISLYAIASNQRATAKEAKEAEETIQQGLREGRLQPPTPDAHLVSEDNLIELGYSAEKAKKLADSYRQNEASKALLKNDAVLAGFGNNGGEEFLSYMMTSESLVLTGGQEWDAWHQKMNRLLSKIQNQNGSWSGHHCITSPVFCTAAVIMIMTADRDLTSANLQSDRG